MAGSINKVILIGNLGGDPEVKYTAGGQAVANFNIATSESWTNKEGTREERTEWHRIVAWGRLAELCGEYLAKGRKVYVEGRLQTRSYEKDGVTRYITEIKANDVQFLDSGAGAGAPAERPAAPERPAAAPSGPRATRSESGGRSYSSRSAPSGGRGNSRDAGPPPDFGPPEYMDGDDDDIPF